MTRPNESDADRCARCKGEGTVYAGPNCHATHLAPCPECEGTGSRTLKAVIRAARAYERAGR